MINKLLILIGLISISACSLSPEQIQTEIDECIAYPDLEPIVILNKTYGVRRVSCVVKEDIGYNLVERDMKLITLPDLPFKR